MPPPPAGRPAPLGTRPLLWGWLRSTPASAPARLKRTDFRERARRAPGPAEVRRNAQALPERRVAPAVSRLRRRFSFFVLCAPGTGRLLLPPARVYICSMLWEIEAGRDGMSAHVPAKVDETCLPLAYVRGLAPRELHK